MKGLLLIGALLFAEACSADAGLAPDLGFRLDCSKQLVKADQTAIAESLFAAGFSVLNTARSAAEQQVSYPYPVKIDAVDPGGRIVSLQGFEPDSGFGAPGQRFTTYVSLFSVPPTRRDAKLEGAILSIMASNPNCSVRDVERNSNGAESMATYQRTLKRTKGWFEQAIEMGSSQRAVRVH